MKRLLVPIKSWWWSLDDFNVLSMKTNQPLRRLFSSTDANFLHGRWKPTGLLGRSVTHSLLSEIVVVGVYTAAQLPCLQETLVAHLVRAIEGNVKLEEARVSLWEAGLAHVCVQADLMLPR